MTHTHARCRNWWNPLSREPETLIYRAYSLRLEHPEQLDMESDLPLSGSMSEDSYASSRNPLFPNFFCQSRLIQFLFFRILSKLEMVFVVNSDPDQRPYIGFLPDLQPAFLALNHKLVHWCSEPSQPLGVISGMKETSIYIYIT